MAHQHATGLDHHDGGVEGVIGATGTSTGHDRLIVAEFFGDDTCTAHGITVRAAAPAPALCRKLVAAGFDPDRPLHVFRGAMLCLIVRTIGECATLTVKERAFGPVFERWAPFPSSPVSPPTRQTGRTVP